MQVTYARVDDQSSVFRVACDCGGTEFTISVTQQYETVWVVTSALLLQCVRCKRILKVAYELENP